MAKEYLMGPISHTSLSIVPLVWLLNSSHVEMPPRKSGKI